MLKKLIQNVIALIPHPKKSYFTDEEFACKCGCGFKEINPTLRMRLNLARFIAGVPFSLSSGCRCESHNKAEGGKPDSSHVKGLAVDIKAHSSRQRFLILVALILTGFNRIGISESFIHVDIDYDKDPDVIWTY